MSLLVKICGLSTAATLDVALDAGADAVGFVFCPPSPRHLGYEAARALGARVKGRAEKGALSVDADDATLAAAVEALRPDAVQLHGNETPARVAGIKQRFGLPVMKAIAIEARGDLAAIAGYVGGAHRLLFEARGARGAPAPGGARKGFASRPL